MADGYKGVSADQDSRFKNKDAALLKSIKFPSNFDQKVDMKKVEIAVMKPWMAQKVTELLGFEDDVVLEYVAGMLEDERYPDPKKMQISLTGFLEAQTAPFMKELWSLLLSAQVSPGGIPAIFVERKKEEMRKKKEEDEKLLRDVRRRDEIGSWDGRQAAGPAGTTSGPSGRTRASRWDRGGADQSQGHRDQRGYARGQGAATFKDKSGNVTERVQDSGWGARAGPPLRSVEGQRAEGNEDPSGIVPAASKEQLSHGPFSRPDADRNGDDSGSRHDGGRYDRDRDRGRDQDQDRERRRDQDQERRRDQDRDHRDRERTFDRHRDDYRRRSPPPLLPRSTDRYDRRDEPRRGGYDRVDRRYPDERYRDDDRDRSRRYTRNEDRSRSRSGSREREHGRRRPARSPRSDRSVTPDYSTRRREGRGGADTDRRSDRRSPRRRNDEVRGAEVERDDSNGRRRRADEADGSGTARGEYDRAAESGSSRRGKRSRWETSEDEETSAHRSQEDETRKEQELREKLLRARRTQA